MKSNLVLALSVMSILAYSPDQVMAKSMAEKSSEVEHYQAIQVLKSKLSPHDDTMKTLMFTQDQKNAVLKNIDAVLKQKNQTIFEYMKLNKSLQAKVDKMGFKDRISAEIKKRKLSDNIEVSNDSLSLLKGTIVEKDLKIQYLQKLLKNQNTQLAAEVKKLNFKIKMMSRNLNSPSSGYDIKQLKLESKHHEVLRTYQNKLFQNQRTIADFKKKFEKNSDYNSIIQENSKLASSLRTAQEELEGYKIAYSKMETKYLAKVREYKKLETYASHIQEKYDQELVSLKGKYTDILENKKMKSSGSRMPASVVEVSKEDEDIAQKDLSHLIELDPERMKIVLDETLLFNRGKTGLDSQSAEKIKKILTVYSKEIFNKPKLRERLRKVQFIGHSSPVYKSKFIDPLTASKEAYDVNMDVSIARARSLANIIFSEEFGFFPHKNEIRSKIVISGKSFSDPKPLMRGPASVSTIACGQYDCEGSQRVEILFEFEKEEKNQ